MKLATSIDQDIRLILLAQTASGAYPASPSYSQYPYSWLRDGSFIAHAMDRAGETESAHRFHSWLAATILKAEDHIRDLIAARDAGLPADHASMPPTRFKLDGSWEDDDWPNFQLDGYGQWLWSLERHLAITAATPTQEILAAATLVASYLEAFWSEPCFDAWEEGRTQHHTSTLASCCAGLRAAWTLMASSPQPLKQAKAARFHEAASDVWRYLRQSCVSNGHFTKWVRNDAVDSSLLWLATPFGLVTDDDPIFAKTLDLIERDLLVGGGLIRYRADTFYGGGVWVLLTAWLAWHHAANGRPQKAARLLAWVERQRGEDGSLPEQVVTAHSDEWFHDYWTERWGPSARPLLWSHAMTLLAATELREARNVSN